jgi:hypothetical protein
VAEGDLCQSWSDGAQNRDRYQMSRISHHQDPAFLDKLLQTTSYSNTCKMFRFKNYTPGILPIAKESQDDSSSERDAMLEHEYQERNPRSRTRRILTSNVPWIFSTMALATYIFISRPSSHQCAAPWSPTDVGELARSVRKTH